MSVFLRWGIFGILSVAGLLYAYNASKSMAERRAARDTPDTAVTARPSEPEPEAVVPAAEPQCAEELLVAERALAARAMDSPLDRLLRIQEIAFQEPPRRARLEKVATFWFNLKGEEPNPEDLRVAVISNCVKARNP